MEKGNHLLSIAAMVVSAFIGTVYITREVSADRDLKLKIEKLENDKKILDIRMDSLSKQVTFKDSVLKARVDSANTHLSVLETQAATAKKNITATLATNKKLSNEHLRLIELMNE